MHKPMPGTNPLWCPRKDTLSQLIDVLNRRLVMHVRGTPTSDKTILATMLAKRLEGEGKGVVLIRNWPRDEFGSDYMAALVKAASKNNLVLEPGRLDDYPEVVFIERPRRPTDMRTFGKDLSRGGRSGNGGPKSVYFPRMGTR